MTGHKNTTKYAPNILSWTVHGVKLISEEKACSVPMQEESRAKNEHSKVKKTPYSSYAGTSLPYLTPCTEAMGMRGPNSAAKQSLLLLV